MPEPKWHGSAQAQRAADHYVPTGKQGDGGRDLALVAEDPVLEPRDRVYGALGSGQYQPERDDHQCEVDEVEHDRRDHRYGGGRVAADEMVQRDEIARAGRTDHRADEDGKPVMRLM